MKFVLVDAFAKKPFSGNPAAVCWISDAWPDDRWLQQFAAEMNQAETAFIAREADHFRLRWFSPVVEVDLCGHATLASAHALMQWQLADRGLIHFETRSGRLTAQAADDNSIELNFPIEPAEPTSPPDGLLKALGLQTPAVYVGRNRFDYLVHLPAASDVCALQPDMALLAKVDCRGVIATAEGEGEFDFISRFFAPRYGIPEDPVTGSAHCCLAPYWRRITCRNRMLGFQASARGGEIQVEVVNDRVLLRGFAITMLSGQVHL